MTTAYIGNGIKALLIFFCKKNWYYSLNWDFKKWYLWIKYCDTSDILK